MKSAASDHTINAEQIAQIEELCRRFQRAWTAIDRPRIADFVQQAAPDFREVAFRELLVIEIEQRRAIGETPSREEYETWRQDHGSAIEDVFSLLDSYRTEHDGNLTKVGAALSVGRVGDYDLLEEIGRGGMGVVHRARDRRLDRDVAVKLMADQFADRVSASARFVAEAKITGQLQHPGIPSVHDLGVTPNGTPYLAMKLVKGQNLHQLLASRDQLQDDRGRYLAIFEQICHAVGYAHAHGVIHRDLKPHNVMVGAHGEVQVMDWGLAKVLSPQADKPETAAEAHSETCAPASIDTPALQDAATHTGAVFGTPQYMPPEQAAGEVRKLEARSDVFGLGAILCEVLTGKPPYWANNSNDVRVKAVRGDLREAMERIDVCRAEPDLVSLAKKCLAFKQEDRPANGQAVADEVARIRTEAEARAREAERDRGEALVREAEGRKRRKLFMIAAGAIGAVLLLGVTGTGYGLIEARLAARAERRAKEDERRAKVVAKAKQREAENERTRAEQREQEAIDAVKRYGEAVANNPELKNSEHLAALRKELLKEPLGFFSSLRERMQSENSTRPDSLDRLAFAGFELGFLTNEIGDKEHAIRVYQESKGIRERLAREQPTVNLYQSNLAKSHLNLGLLFYETGKTAEAQAAFEAANEIFEKLSRENPTVTEFQSSLAASHNNLGALLAERNKLPEALAAHEAAKEIRERLAREKPDVSEFQSELAKTHANLGRLLLATGKSTEALSAYEAAKEIQERLVEEQPELSEFQSDLARSYNHLGRLLLATGKTSEALAAHQAEATIFERLARNNPTNTEYQSNLARSNGNLGVLLTQTGKPTEALAAFEVVKLVFDRLARENPTVPRFQSDLAATNHNIGDLLSTTGKTAEALTAFEAAIAIFEGLVRKFPDVAEFQYRLANSHGGRGAVLNSLGKSRDAFAAFEAAKEIYERLAQENLAVTDFQSMLARTLHNLAELKLESKETLQARLLQLDAVSHQKKALAANPRHPIYRQLLKDHYTGLQIIAKRLNDPELEWEAKAGFAELATSDPQYIAIDQRLAAVVSGAPATDVAELLSLAVRTYETRKFALSARFYGEAMDGDESLAADRQTQHAYNAACSAALAVGGEDVTQPPLGNKAKEELRDQALTWLKNELAAWEKLLENPESRQVIAETLQHWQDDADLSAIRDAEKLAALPEDERMEWESLWAKVKEIAAKAAQEMRPDQGPHESTESSTQQEADIPLEPPSPEATSN